MKAVLNKYGVLNCCNISRGQLIIPPFLIFAAELAFISLDMSLLFGQMLCHAELGLLLELPLAAHRRLTGRIGRIALIIDEAGAFVRLIAESSHILAQLLESFDGQPILLDIGGQVGQFVLFGVEDEVPGRHSILVRGRYLCPGFGHIFAERVFPAAGDGKVRHIDDAGPAEAGEWVRGGLERSAGSDEGEVIGRELAEALVLV